MSINRNQSVFINVTAIFVCILFFFHGRLMAQKQIVAGEIEMPYPTLINLAFEWYIAGDNNYNASVDVAYRKQSTVVWNCAMPLRRIRKGEYEGFKWRERFSGSIFDLQPGTSYEVRLTLTDPDGGSLARIVHAQTRPVPDDSNGEIHDIAPGRYDTLHTKSGTLEKPVVYRCRNGIASFQFIDMTAKKYVFIEGINVENLATEGVGIRMDGAEWCNIINNNINAVYGIVADKPGATNCYFSDNVIEGICTWELSSMGNLGKNEGEGIQITGPGNVICYNKVSKFRDCISTMEGIRASNQTCVDIYNNDIYEGVDDGIEADFCLSNCRIVRNRLTDCCVGLSSQPGLGGPTYFIRNVMYNIIHSGFKLKRFSRGDVVLHNTLIKIGVGLGGNSKMDYAFFRNNLTFGGPTYGVVLPGGYDTGRPFASDVIAPGRHSSFDYDAVGVWGTPYRAQIGKQKFEDVEKHGTGKLDFSATFPQVSFPENALSVTRLVPDLRPSLQSNVIDAGEVIPNVNDDFNGKAPDCGAFEQGKVLPHYGPRKTL
jgi:hypothetical protein